MTLRVRSFAASPLECDSHTPTLWKGRTAAVTRPPAKTMISKPTSSAAPVHRMVIWRIRCSIPVLHRRNDNALAIRDDPLLGLFAGGEHSTWARSTISFEYPDVFNDVYMPSKSCVFAHVGQCSLSHSLRASMQSWQTIRGRDLCARTEQPPKAASSVCGNCVPRARR